VIPLLLDLFLREILVVACLPPFSFFCLRGPGLWFRVQGLWFRPGFMVQGSWLMVQGFMVQASWFRVQGSGFRLEDVWVRV
jgi:hypothetical protein